MRFTLLLFLFFSWRIVALAQSITGDVIDIADRLPITDVSIQNIHTGYTVTTDEEGKFEILATKGQLLEFRKLGFKTVRIRLPEGTIPPYFKIVMQTGPIELPEFELEDGVPDYAKDSLEYYELYKNFLEFPELTGLDVIRHPFSAMSKRNRQIWAFQKEYTRFEQEKYVDYMFNERLVGNITGLTGDSLQYYMRRYRPSYEQLRMMNDYNFYLYIRESAEVYRNIRRLREGFRRSPN